MGNLYVLAQQTEPRVRKDGADTYARGTRDGIPFAATWKQALLMEGRCFHMDVGDLANGALTALIRGGGVGGVTDLDQPEFGVSVAQGTALLPLDIHISVSCDIAADDELAEAVLIADTAAAFAADGTTVAVTPTNMLTDGPASVATCFGEGSADITDPTCSMILDHELVRSAAITADTAAVAVYLHLHYAPAIPPILKGPAAFYGFGGGTTRADLCAAVVWAEVPEGRYTVN